MKERRITKLILATSLFLIALRAFGLEPPNKIQIYTTNGPAEDVRKYILPLLRKSETLSLFRGKIIVNASIYTHDSIQDLLSRIDKPQQNLRISLRKQKALSAPSPSTPQSVILFSGSNADGSLSVKNEHRKPRLVEAQPDHQFTLLEGATGYIKGDSETYKDSAVFKNGFFTTTQELQKNGTGSYITVKLNNNNAQISLSPNDPSNKNSSTASSDVFSIPLNQWFPMQRGRVFSKTDNRMEIRVEIVH